MKYKGAIFDVDGTLFDSMAIWRSIAREYLKTLGITAPPELDDIVHGMSLKEGAAYLKKEYKLLHSVEEICEGVNKLTESKYYYEVKLKDGIRELLDRLKSENVKMCVATVTDKYLIEKAFERLDVADYFTDIITCSMVGASKQQPDIYEAALAAIGTKKDETIIFEDSAYAIATAKSANFAVVGIYDAHEKKQDIIKQTADYYITDYRGNEIEKIFV